MAEVNLLSVGLLAIVIGLVLIFIGILLQSKGNAKIEGGGIFFIGPFPIGFASSERAFYILLVVSVILFILFFVMNYVKQ